MKRFLLLYLFIPSAAMAAVERCAMQTTQDVLSCALKRHPEVARAEAALRAAAAAESAARQIPNPDFSAESASFSDAAQPALKLEAAYLHPFEIGGKRSGRVRQARAGKRLAEANLRIAREEALLQTLLSLHRLRQLRVEEKATEESRKTFAQIVESYRSRLQRNPEQETSFHVFRMARSDYDLRAAALRQEKERLKAGLELATQAAFDDILTALPAETRDWPVVRKDVSAAGGAHQQALALVGLSQAERGLAQSQAWPDVRVGPRVEVESGRGQEATGVGASLALPLPLYQRNQGGRSAAKARVEESQIHLQQTERELNSQRAAWTAAYEEAVRAYRQAPSAEEIEKNHETVERLFQRGVVPAPLVIEAHRQMVDLTKARHEQELRALEALWTIRVIEGRALEESL